MDIKYTKKEKNEIEFIVDNEDSAIFDLIVEKANTKREVEFVSKKEADLQRPEFTIYLKTKDKNAKDVLLECIKEAEEDFQNVLTHIEKAAEKIKE